MPKLKGLLLLIPSLFIIIVEFYYLIYQPVKNDTLPTLNSEQYWALAIPVFILTVFVSFMIGWIGYTMIVTKEPIRMTYDSAYEEAAGEKLNTNNS